MGLYDFDTFTFDPARGELSEQRRGQIPLRHKVSRLLEYLLSNRDRLVSKEELLEKLWQHGDYRENSLTQSVRELRKALGDSAQNSRYIKTFPQRGYQWICPLTRRESMEKKEAEEVDAEEETSQERNRTRARFTALAAALLLTVLGFWQVGKSVTGATPETRQAATPKLLVLPFDNDTGDRGRDWLELGLSDMLASSLQRAGKVRVTPPAISQGLLLAEGLEWPTLPTNLRALLRERGYDQALMASVREHDARQVMDYQLLSSDGSIHEGSVTYTSLTANSDAIARQLMYLVNPQVALEPNPATGGPNADAVLASQARAQGISALHTSGAERADNYFQAALLLTPENSELKACRGKSRVLLGDWQGAEELLTAADESAGNDRAQMAFARYWQAELAYRTGEDARAESLLTEVIDLAGPDHNIQILADAYRLRARIAWTHRQWQKHRNLLARADELLPRNGDLSIEAQKLFYLGSPISQGLEKDPQQDLILSRDRLLKALNYYSQLGNRPMIAATQFALAQNYVMDMEQRHAALEQAIALYEELEQPYELTETLVYASFFQLQLRQGQQATIFVERAQDVIDQLGGHRLQGELNFYRAFALLDQGLDQRYRGGRSTDAVMLRRAIAEFSKLSDSSGSKITRADSLVMLGWAYADLQQYEQALNALTEARQLSQELAMETTLGYAIYAMMHIHLEQKNYAEVIELGQQPVTARQQLTYLARAYYELGRFSKAADTLKRLKNQFPNLWSEADEQRLAIYQAPDNDAAPQQLGPEPPAHSVYCESDWSISKPFSVNT